MPNTGFSYPWEIDDLAISKSGRYHPDHKAVETFGRPHTNADCDMEGPFKNFTTPNGATKTNLGTIKAAGNLTRAGVQRAITAQFDF